MAHVLVVENDETVQILIMRFLRRAGYTFIVVSDGQEAWEFLAERRELSFILSDYNMLEMSGIELLRRVRADERTAKIPFFLMSGRRTVLEFDQRNLKEVCNGLNAIFIEKPFDYKTFVAQLPRIEVKREMDDS